MAVHTQASARFPEVPHEQLLQCWRCKLSFPVWGYDYSRNCTDSEPPAKMLERAKDSIERGHRRACHNCIDELATAPPTTSDDVRGNWMLEVQVADTGHPVKCTTFRHLGYMRMGFSSQRKAAEYYAAHNPHMRAIDAAHDWCSDWDPTTYRRYVVRRHCNSVATIDAFE